MIDALPMPGLVTLLDLSPGAILVVDETCVIRYANPALERLSGYRIAELLGQPLNLLLPEPVAAKHDGQIREYCRNPGFSKVLGETREMVLRSRGDRPVPIALKAVDLGAEHGQRLFGAFLTDLRPQKALEAANETLLARLEQEALIDALTGLPNRRAFDAEAVRALARAQRDRTQTLFAVLDIDHFKAINDDFGPAAGDAVLRTLARSVQLAMRAGDYLARIGGEEFGWLLPRITVEQAVPAVERIRVAVATTETSLAGHRGITMTISAGLTLLDTTLPLNASLERADAALFKAKTQGRNRLVVWPG
jgi:diguanylate cyclase (GGDEF)-like protein/PAS domain S-box-containing protein